MQDFENMPIKESMRDNVKHKKYNKFNTHGFEKRFNKFHNIDRKLANSVGENYDNVYSWFCNKYKNEDDFVRLKSYFLDCFVDFCIINLEIGKEYSPFLLDENKTIQRNPHYKSWNKNRNIRNIIENIHWVYYRLISKKNDSVCRVEISEKQYHELSPLDTERKIVYTLKEVAKHSKEWKQYVGSGQYFKDKKYLLNNGVSEFEI